MYKRWKRDHPTAGKHEKAELCRQCKGKKAHPDLLSAMKHAALHERLFPGTIVVAYKCELCKQNHIATRATRDKWWERPGYSDTFTNIGD